jgi:LPS-assembly protein
MFPMIARRGIFITSALLCHLLLAAVLVTSALHAQVQEVQLSSPPVTGIPAEPSGPANTQQRGTAPTASAKKKSPRPTNTGEPVTLTAQQQERHGDLYYLRGEAEVDYRNYRLHADKITYNDATGEVKVEGHVVFDGGPHDLHLTATHGTYNVNTEKGRFWDAVGTLGIRLRGKTIMITSSSPFAFRGAIVDKEGPDRYVVQSGMVTSCALAEPKWSLHAQHATVVAGKNAKLYNSTFWLWHIPIFYSPFFDHPTERTARKTGFLMPVGGVSSTRGTLLGEGFFWNINRSTDATIAAQLYSKRGWAQRVIFRDILNDKTNLYVNFYGVTDRGAPSSVTKQINGVSVTLPAKQNQGGQDVRVVGDTTLFNEVRGVLDVDYLSSLLFRQAFATSFAEAISSEVFSSAFLTDNRNGYSFNAWAERYQNFQSNTPGNQNVINITHEPSLQMSTVDRPLGDSPAYWGFSSSIDALRRSEPDFVQGTNVAGRFDLSPHLSLPRIWHGWMLRPEVAIRDTVYSTGLVPGGAFGQTSGSAVNRHALETQLELRPPPLERAFDSDLFGARLKHTIEPRVIYRDVSGVDNFSSIPRFDATDILSDTNELEYAVVQRLYAKPLPRNCGAQGSQANVGQPNLVTPANRKKKKAPKNCTPVPASEVISWELAQKYFFDPYFGRALVSGQSNVLATTVDFTGIAFLTAPRVFSPVSSRVRLRTGRLDSEWHLDYDTALGRLNSSEINLTYNFPRDIALSGGNYFLHMPLAVLPANSQTAASTVTQFNQFVINARYGTPGRKGFNMATSYYRDADLGHMIVTAQQVTYNWDCCGVTFEYRRFWLSPTLNDNQYKIGLSLANVGTLGNLRRTERLF